MSERRPDVIINLPQPLGVLGRMLRSFPRGSTFSWAPGRTDQMLIFIPDPLGGDAPERRTVPDPAPGEDGASS